MTVEIAHCLLLKSASWCWMTTGHGGYKVSTMPSQRVALHLKLSTAEIVLSCAMQTAVLLLLIMLQIDVCLLTSEVYSVQWQEDCALSSTSC